MPYVGAQDPETLDLTVTTVGGFDLSAVTSAEISIKTPKGATLSWSWTVQNAVAGSVHLVHTFAADGSDIAYAGNYVIHGFLIAGSVRRRIKPITVQFKSYP